MKMGFVIGFLSFTIAGAVMADTLELKNGQRLDGKFVGGTDQTISFQTGGETKVFSRSEIVSLNVGGGGTGTPSAGTASGATAPAVGTGAGTAVSQPATVVTMVTVPAGTPLVVRMSGGVSSSQPAGTKFSGTLLQDVTANGARVAPAGTVVYGQVAHSAQAGRLAGQSGLSLVLTDIVINGTPQPLVTDPISLSGEREGRNTVRRAGAGAAVGAIFGGGEGAGKGAAIGAGAGVLRRGQEVDVQPGATLEFGLSQPLTMQSAH